MQGRRPSTNMGGKDDISSYCLISMNLINSARYDLDTSMGISFFMEQTTGMASRWYFILPNTTEEGENKAIVIKLFNGSAISCDGQKVFHCTGLEGIGTNNHVYGNYFGGKKYK